MLRGLVRDVVEGTHVVMELDDGTVTRVPWGEVASLEVDTTATP